MKKKEWQELAKSIHNAIDWNSGVCVAIRDGCVVTFPSREIYRKRIMSKIVLLLSRHYDIPQNPLYDDAYYLGPKYSNKDFRKDCWDLLAAKIELNGIYRRL